MANIKGNIIGKIKDLNKKIKEEKEIEIIDFPYWGEKGEA